MKKRILVLLSVVALMVVMLATSVAPAFAAWTGADGQCRGTACCSKYLTRLTRRTRSQPFL